MGSTYRRKRRTALWNRDPHCYWCGRLTVLEVAAPGEQPQPDFATLDHLNTKFDEGRRVQYRPETETTVLACYDCNWRRGQERFFQMPPDVRNEQRIRKAGDVRPSR